MEIYPDSVVEQLAFVKKEKNLQGINDLFTHLMAGQKIQALIKDENLSTVCNRVVDVALLNRDAIKQNGLLAAAILGRLSAVARGREDIVFARVKNLFLEAPPGIETLADGDEKYYAAISLASLNEPWLSDYFSNQSVLTDTSEKARRIMVQAMLERSGSLSNYWQINMRSLGELRSIEGDDTRFKKIRRITNVVTEVAKSWGGDVGQDAGLALGDWFDSIFRSSKRDVEDEVLTDIIDDGIALLLRIIELRFSNALQDSTYVLLDRVRAILGRDRWTVLMRSSKNLEKIRTCLKESALVLARQGKTDKKIMSVLSATYYSSAQLIPAISAHFSAAQEIDPNVKAWWENGGVVSESAREPEHKMGNIEDQQIGSLLINVEESQSVMEKLRRAVVPSLEIYDPPLAETVKKAAGNFNEISLAARQLASMRKLKHMGLKGVILDYNPMEHEMLGGHKLGVRQVKIERDGIQKDFGGKIKTLVKPRVVPEE